MIDLNRKPEKSKEEIEFEELNKQYQEKFGKPFVFAVGMYAPTWKEALKDIQKCLSTGEIQRIPEYDKELLY